MGGSRLTPEEIRAAAEIHDELGPEYRDAVVASFLERIDEDVAARIDAQLGTVRQPAVPAPDPAELARKRAQLGAMAAGSGLAALASGLAVEWSLHYPGSSPVKALLLVWTIVAVGYLVWAWRLRRR